jgi:hypothetical protein
MHILDPNWATAFALATNVTHRLPLALAAIEAGRRMRTSSWSFPSSSCSQTTPTLSHHCHLSPEEPPCYREPQLSSAESFAALRECPRDPLSILSFSSSRLVHQSTPSAMLRQAGRSAMAPPGFPCRAVVERAGANLHRPFVDRRPRLEPEDTPSCFKSWSKIWEPMALI